jgi:hypothetical protein
MGSCRAQALGLHESRYQSALTSYAEHWQLSLFRRWSYESRCLSTLLPLPFSVSEHWLIDSSLAECNDPERPSYSASTYYLALMSISLHCIPAHRKHRDTTLDPFIATLRAIFLGPHHTCRSTYRLLGLSICTVSTAAEPRDIGITLYNQRAWGSVYISQREFVSQSLNQEGLHRKCVAEGGWDGGGDGLVKGMERSMKKRVGRS